MPESLQDLVYRVFRYALPVAIGAMLMLFADSRADRARDAANEERLAKLEQEVSTITSTLANGGPQPLAKRIDDLSSRFDRQGEQVNAKLDNLTQLIMQLQTRR